MPKLAAPLDAGTNKITNLGTPTASTDAATKAYVDASAGGGGGGGTASFPPSLLQYANLSAQPTWATSNSASIYFAELPPSTSIMVAILYIQTGNGLSVTTPTGWTLIATLTDSTHNRAFILARPRSWAPTPAWRTLCRRPRTPPCRTARSWIYGRGSMAVGRAPGRAAR